MHEIACDRCADAATTYNVRHVPPRVAAASAGRDSLLCFQEMVLKEFEEKLDGVVNFEVAPDNIGNNVNRGFGFCTFKDQEACKAAHAKHESTKLEILVSGDLLVWALYV